ncbi:hypothetical protein O1Q96_00715 (plasmid) [Streptomyces sp. Qhu-G9]|uniref:hypothetical protein n=1 Tax=Streptomyces sp. Qhu-G9 TaxID=3452799 RepID=UPI0022AC4D5A|nr:hypothetical protein [Streptomyces aurantiacus]WAU78585.1 hypothetical protein O1Q96_00715 [Streptomyces aurantiacus]
MDLDGRASVADAEFGEPFRLRGPSLPPAFLLGFPLLDGGDFVVDALQPHGVPGPQGQQSCQVSGQVVEHGLAPDPAGREGPATRIFEF